MQKDPFGSFCICGKCSARACYYFRMPPQIYAHITNADTLGRENVSKNAVAVFGDGLTRWALSALLLLMPFAILPVPWTSIAQSKVLIAAIIAIIAIFAWIIARLAEGFVRIPKSALLWVTLLLPFAYLVSTAVSGWTNTSLVGTGVEQDTLVAVTIWYTLFALSVLVFHTGRPGIKAHVRAAMTGFTVLAVFQALFVFFPSWLSLGGILQSPTANLLGSWHDLGILAGLSLFLSFALFRSTLFNGVWRAIPIILGLSSFFLVIVIHFADVLWATAALFAVGTLAVVRAAMRTDGVTVMNMFVRALPFLLVSILMAVAAFFSVQLAERLPERVQRSEVEVRPSWQGTFDVAKQSLGAPTSLVFGSGPNSFIREWGLHKPQGVNLTPFWNSDFNYGIGVIPTSIFAVGLFGLLAWAGILLVLLGLLYRVAREVRPLTPGRTLFGTLVIAVAYLVTFHMIYTPGVALTGITFLLMGLLAVAANGDAPPRTLRLGFGWPSAVFTLFIVLISAGTVVASGFGAREVVSNLYVNKGAYGYQQSSDVALASRNLGRALIVSPGNDRAHRAAAELGIVELSQLLANGTPATEEARQQLEETLQKTIQHGLTAVEIDGENYQNWLSLAQIYSNLAGANVEGSLESARGAYEEAFKTQPSNPVPKLRLAQLAIARNDIPAARQNLQDAIALKPDFAAAYYLLSQVEAADGKGDPAVTAAAQAVQLVPEDPIGWFNLGYIFFSARSYENAAAALEKAATLTPDYANALFVLGLTYNGMGRTDEAVMVFQRVAQLNPGESWISQVILNVQAKKDPFDGLQR